MPLKQLAYDVGRVQDVAASIYFEGNKSVPNQKMQAFDSIRGLGVRKVWHPVWMAWIGRRQAGKINSRATVQLAHRHTKEIDSLRYIPAKELGYIHENRLKLIYIKSIK